jgi:hypothetical protein
MGHGFGPCGSLLNWPDVSALWLQAITSQCRAYLAAVIIWLAGQKGKEAYLCYQVSCSTHSICW